MLITIPLTLPYPLSYNSIHTQPIHYEVTTMNTTTSLALLRRALFYSELLTEVLDTEFWPEYSFDLKRFYFNAALCFHLAVGK